MDENMNKSTKRKKRVTKGWEGRGRRGRSWVDGNILEWGRGK